MKKILGLTIAALMVMGLVGGGTWAYFSDTETIGDNQFLAGTLDLGLDTSSGQDPVGSITGTFSASDWAPGDTSTATIYVNNEGSIAMASVNISFSNTSVIDGTPVSVDAGPGGDSDDLLKMIKITDFKYGPTGSQVDIVSLENQDITQLAAIGYDLGGLAADTEYQLDIVFTFDGAATNGCQGDSANLTVTFTGLQQ